MSINHLDVTKLRSVLYAADEPANFYLETADGRTHLVSCAEWYEVMMAIHDDPALRFRAAGDDCFVVEPVAGVDTCSRPATVEEAIEAMRVRGMAHKPKLAKRLDSAAELVRLGKVHLKGEQAKVGPYTVSAVACTCPDFQHRERWCKHRLAVRMARYLLANGYELPREAEAAPRSQISQANRELIATGKVIDAAQRARQAYANSEHGARTAALRMLGNGARTLPADLARRAGIKPSDE